jgi:hypothetical protein
MFCNTHSSWYASLPPSEQRFVRGYIIRSIWAFQAVYTSLSTLGILVPDHQATERSDKIAGWSRL